MPRDKIIRIGAIAIILALLLSLIAGAISITPTPPANAESVQIMTSDDSPTGTAIDTDGDGIPNNEDPDIDNDGVVNANDGDIDGDGVSNFDDGDPAATNGYDGKTPNKPGSISFQELSQNGLYFWILGGLVALLGTGILILRNTQQKRGKITEKKL